MFVNRRVLIPKRGHYQDLVSLLKSTMEAIDHPHAVRIYKTTRITAAPYDQVVWEIEYESLAEYERLKHEWASRPDAASFGNNMPNSLRMVELAKSGK